MQKSLKPLKTLAAVGLAVVSLALAGCSTTGYKKGDATAASMHEATGRLEAESRALDATVERLNDLVNNPAPDPKGQFAGFNAALDWLTDSAAEADAAIRRTRERSADYFATWDKELAAMDYEVIRTGSTDRKNAVSNQVDGVCRRYEETQAVVAPLIVYFDDIRRALESDLTREGLESVKPVARNADANARKVQTALAQLAVDLMAASSRLSSSMPTSQFSRTTTDSTDETPRTEAAVR